MNTAMANLFGLPELFPRADQQNPVARVPLRSTRATAATAAGAERPKISRVYGLQYDAYHAIDPSNRCEDIRHADTDSCGCADRAARIRQSGHRADAVPGIGAAAQRGRRGA